MQQHELLITKLLAFAPKAFGAIVGAILSLVLSGDIDREGRLQLGKTVLIKFIVSAAVGAYFGDAIIILMDWQDKPLMFHGAIWLGCASIGLLVIGIIYQSIALYQGKTLPELVRDIKETFISIFK